MVDREDRFGDDGIIPFEIIEEDKGTPECCWLG